MSTDLQHLCDESGVGAEVQADHLPMHPLLTNATPEQALRDALHGGEDYELLFTATRDTQMPRSVGGIPVTCIGRITRDKAITLRRNGNAEPLPPGGWEHDL